MPNNFDAVIREIISWNDLGNIDNGCLSPMSLELIREPGMFEYLIGILNDPDDNVIRAAITAMGFLGDPRSIQYMEEMIKCELINYIDDESIEAMIRIGPDSRDCIIRLINYGIPDLTTTIIDAFEGVKYDWVYEMFAELLESDDPNTRYIAIRALYLTGNPSACNDAEYALRQDVDIRVRIYALRILYEFGVTEPIIKALSDEKSIIRTNATNYIEDLDHPDAIPSLCRAADIETDDMVLENMLKSLGRIRSPDAIDVFIKALRHDNEDIRENAIRGLVNLGDDSLEALSMALRCSDPYIRECTADAIVRIGSDAAVDVLIVAVKDSDPRVRRRAALSLKYVNDPRKVDALESIVNDSELRVRNAAKFVLGRRMG
jgi:HEAT repeat protein